MNIADATQIDEVRRAIVAGEFHLVYQPIVDLRAGVSVGAEALVRWTHPELGLVPPAEFIPLTENSRAIVDLGSWVLDTALGDAVWWVEPGRPRSFLSVNLSGTQLLQPDYAQEVLHLCAVHAFPTDALWLELIESDFDAADPVALANLRTLSDAGVRLMLDDYGSGSSNFARWEVTHATVLKIPREFTAAITDGGSCASEVSAILDVAATLSLDAIAEGVETVEQLRWLQAHGCNLMQGYLFSAGVLHDDVAAMCIRVREKVLEIA